MSKETLVDGNNRLYCHHRVDGLSRKEIESLAGEYSPPEWASHIAVRFDGSKVEPAVWRDQEKAFLDEDPASMRPGEWAGAFKRSYWAFVPISRGEQ